MKKLLTALTALLVIFVSCTNTDKAATRLLQFNLQKGKTYVYDLDGSMKQEVMGRSSDINIASTYKIDVTGENETSKTLQVTYDRFRMAFDMAGVQAEVDTDKPMPAQTLADGKPNPAYMMSQVFAGIKGKSFTMQVDKSGNVTSVSGMEEVIKTMVANSAADESQKMQMEMSLRDQLNEDNIREQFGMVFNIYPGKEVKAGDSWDKTFQMGGKMAGNYTSKYKVKDVKGDKVDLEVSTDISQEKKDSTMAVDMKGLQTGTLTVDSRTGLVENAVYNQDITVKNADFTVAIKGKYNITGKEK